MAKKSNKKADKSRFLSKIDKDLKSSGSDKRDKPIKIEKKALVKNVSKLLKESEKKEKKIIADRKKEKQSKSTGSTALLQKSKITVSKTAKPVKKKEAPTRDKFKKKGSKKSYEYYNEFLEGIKEFHKKKPTKKDVEELKRKKKNLQNQKYRLDAKLKKSQRKRLAKNKLTKKALNKLNKDTLHLSVAINEINKKIGKGKELKEAPKRKSRTIKKKEKVGKKEVLKNILEEVVAVWEGREKLTNLLKKGFFVTYVILGAEFDKNQVPQIFSKYTEIEHRIYSTGSTTPRVVFAQNITDKEVQITQFD